jgi:long-chain acyl-CoA synthetase
VSAYDDKPWLGIYAEGRPAVLSPEFGDALAMFKAAVERNPDGDLVRYFDGRLTLRELDELSDAFAVGLLDSGFARGDRVTLYL